MRIGIDLRWLHEALSQGDRRLEMSGGIGGYSLNLTRQILSLDSENEYVLFGNVTYPQERLNEYFLLYRNVRIKLLPAKLKVPLAKATLGAGLNKSWERWRIVPEIEREELDVFHLQEQGASVFSGRREKQVITVHDLMCSVFPEHYFRNPLAHWWWKKQVKSFRKANAIIAISENTKQDILKYAKVAPQKVKVIYYGLSKRFGLFKKEERRGEKLLAQYGIRKPYLIYVGGLQPTKNIPRLISAYRILKERLPAVPMLVMVGEFRFWPEAQEWLLRELKMTNLDLNVALTGWLSQECLGGLLSEAEALVHPALYEGFGFTPLEAMACGCPVVVSKRASIPEVVGEAGIYVDPYNVEDIAHGIMRVFKDRNLRDVLVQKGLERARLFSWEKAASETYAVYAEVAKEGRGARRKATAVFI